MNREHIDEEIDQDEVEQEASNDAEELFACSDEKVKLREKLQADMTAFLQRGGHVTVVADNVRADPPRKPNVNYGTGPI